MNAVDILKALVFFVIGILLGVSGFLLYTHRAWRIKRPGTDAITNRTSLTPVTSKAKEDQAR